jgi:branched-chain amino acid transport system permease protein
MDIGDILTILPQQIVFGLALGAVYALLAVGYTMVYGVLFMINFAHGDVLMIGAFATLALIAAGTPWLLVAPVVLLTGALAGITIERAVFRPPAARRRSRASSPPSPSR